LVPLPCLTFLYSEICLVCIDLCAVDAILVCGTTLHTRLQTQGALVLKTAARRMRPTCYGRANDSGFCQVRRVVLFSI
jgi:hypothetical protein